MLNELAEWVVDIDDVVMVTDNAANILKAYS